VDLSETTDVAERPEFRDRRRNVTLASAVEADAEGRPRQVQVQGFFSFDFTLAEIKSLRAKQRLTQRSATYNGLFQVRGGVLLAFWAPAAPFPWMNERTEEHSSHAKHPPTLTPTTNPRCRRSRR